MACLANTLGARGSAGLSATDACCKYGGGHTYGMGLVMDEFSPIFCRPAHDTPASEQILCSCSSDTDRFDVNQSTCVAACAAGMFWIDDNATTAIDFAVTRAGRCDFCEAGSVATGEVNDPFPLACDPCDGGTFTDEIGQASCKTCAANFYSDAGAVECLRCPFGKSSESGNPRCTPCETLRLGSEHCDSPYLGYALAIVVVFVCTTAFCVLYRWRRRTRKNTSALRTQLDEQTELVKATADDLDLMSAGWIIREDEIAFQRLIARGGYGEVWRGSLRGTYTVAIKKMFPEVGGANVSQVNFLESNAEVRFLQRARHPRLVMFLGCGYTRNGGGDADDASIFVVLEYCDRGDLTHFLYKNSADAGGDNDDDDVNNGKKKRPPTWIDRIALLVDVAEGMRYGHNKRRGACRSSTSYLSFPFPRIAFRESIFRVLAVRFSLSPLVSLSRARQISSLRSAQHSS